MLSPASSPDHLYRAASYGFSAPSAACSVPRDCSSICIACLHPQPCLIHLHPSPASSVSIPALPLPASTQLCLSLLHPTLSLLVSIPGPAWPAVGLCAHLGQEAPESQSLTPNSFSPRFCSAMPHGASAVTPQLRAPSAASCLCPAVGRAQPPTIVGPSCPILPPGTSWPRGTVAAGPQAGVCPGGQLGPVLGSPTARARARHPSPAAESGAAPACEQPQAGKVPGRWGKACPQ